MARHSYRVKFPGGSGFDLAGIVDRPDVRNTPSDGHPTAGEESPVPGVVFSHCFTCNKDLKAIVRISRALADQGIAVLRYDMTGLGGSQGDFSQTSFTTNVADVRAAITFARSEFGNVTALLGHSFGGAASLAVAGSDRSSATAVVALAAPSDTIHLAELLSKMDPAIEDAGIGTVSIGGRSWSIRREMLDDFRSHDLPQLTSRIAAPTLLLHSPVDKTVGFDHALRNMGLIQASPHGSTPVSLISLDRADHLLSESSADLRFVAGSVGAFIHRYSLPE